MSDHSSPFGPVAKWGLASEREAQAAELTAAAEKYLADEEAPLTFLDAMGIAYLPIVAAQRRRERGA
jgi:hypothetical protein